MAVTIKIHYYQEHYTMQQARCFGGGVFLRFHRQIVRPEELGILLAEDVEFYWTRVFKRLRMEYINGHSASWKNLQESWYVQKPLNAEEEEIVQETFHNRLREIANIAKY